MASMSQSGSYPVAAFVLTLIGGILILLDGLYVAAIAAFIGSVVGAFFPGLGLLIIALGVIALLFGLIILVGAIQMHSHPQSAKTWGIIVLILALISFVGGGGFYLGAILAIVGGILAIVWHPPMPAPSGMGMGTPMAGGTAPQWNAPPPAAAPSGGGKVCASCGSPIAAGAQFCPKCGAPSS
jgi:hypothetical protein